MEGLCRFDQRNTRKLLFKTECTVCKWKTQVQHLEFCQNEIVIILAKNMLLSYPALTQLITHVSFQKTHNAANVSMPFPFTEM